MDKKILFFASFMLILVGCSYSKNHPPTDHNITCENIKQKLAFPSPDTNEKIDYNSPTKQAELYREYQKYNCDAKQ